MSKNNLITRLQAKVLASKLVCPGYLTVRLLFDTAQLGLSAGLLKYNNYNGVLLNISEDSLRADVLFSGLAAVNIHPGLELELACYSLTLRESSPDLILIPKNSLIVGLASVLLQADSSLCKNSLFLFECDELPLSIRPSLRVIENLPNEVIGNFQLLEDHGIAARIASEKGNIGCYEGDLLNMLNDYLSSYFRFYPNKKLSIMVFPGLSTESKHQLKSLELDLELAVEYVNDEYC
ncbi:hypothetical protein [Piscirickettsia litoralis]|uniref:Uncharacterized protein n=1 Tax=Piscirickettsia litoralis TaxID=1891921 RepID=A0ABX3A2K0_9GAMM|nr:hypothetical protein [Piscirickettsia litoralis]ODN43097.1 hypothetical protein BGC07_09435 [Piscirickettsia litoralis]